MPGSLTPAPRKTTLIPGDTLMVYGEVLPGRPTALYRITWDVDTETGHCRQTVQELSDDEQAIYMNEWDED